jgi:hypothetical protein
MRSNPHKEEVMSKIIPVHPDSVKSSATPTITETTIRRVFGGRFPSRRTFGGKIPSRRTFGGRFPSRRTFGGRMP